ncbi:FeoA family protein [Escherichia phage G_AB-2017]|uniref:FeoA family protein n=2 Tax=root TaxID=1 RepID=A0A1Q1PUM6_9CAUD|nr:FeoA family protein [Escherichia phage G AB-2017]
MRIRITDRRLIDFGISVGDVFPAFSSNHYGFMIEYKGSLLFVYRDECEVLV